MKTRPARPDDPGHDLGQVWGPVASGEPGHGGEGGDGGAVGRRVAEDEVGPIDRVAHLADQEQPSEGPQPVAVDDQRSVREVVGDDERGQSLSGQHDHEQWSPEPGDRGDGDEQPGAEQVGDERHLGDPILEQAGDNGHDQEAGTHHQPDPASRTVDVEPGEPEGREPGPQRHGNGRAVLQSGEGADQGPVRPPDRREPRGEPEDRGDHGHQHQPGPPRDRCRPPRTDRRPGPSPRLRRPRWQQACRAASAARDRRPSLQPPRPRAMCPWPAPGRRR